MANRYTAPWTPENEKRLRDLWAVHKGAAPVQREMKEFTLGQISNKAKRLGLMDPTHPRNSRRKIEDVRADDIVPPCIPLRTERQPRKSVVPALNFRRPPPVSMTKREMEEQLRQAVLNTQRIKID